MSCPFLCLPLDVLQYVLFPLLDATSLLALMVASTGLEELLEARNDRFGSLLQAWLFSPSFQTRSTLELLSRSKRHDLDLRNVHPYRLHSTQFKVLSHTTELRGVRNVDVQALLKRKRTACTSLKVDLVGVFLFSCFLITH
jgi:hypothetical protein